jgi:hypothetical protein
LLLNFISRLHTAPGCAFFLKDMRGESACRPDL